MRASFALRHGETAITGKYHTAPIKIAKTFPLDGQLGVMMMDVSPGLLAGDGYELSWQAGRDTRLYLTNQSYTKVHPCPDGTSASMKQRFLVDDGAYIENMMEPVMLYKDAAYTNETEVFLGRGSVWMQAEVLSPGRLLRGEKFQYRRYDNRMRVYYEEEMIFAQRQLIEPATQQLDAPGAWEDWSHIGSFYCFSDAIESVHADTLRAALQALPERLGQPIKYGVSLTYRHGLAVAVAGHTAWQLQELLQSAWTVMRCELMKLPPIRFRK
ncbi:urease accessory protein UreD [Paenibacillus abyssi]|uniref:Urease accessory protein UreD n=1 Tax=Paenibacillus abyssi TaxID=1340531 RepID=A0A917G2T1_9BACL|nr:urease accessory protein UreD [Paenibacillus abyssi]